MLLPKVRLRAATKEQNRHDAQQMIRPQHEGKLHTGSRCSARRHDSSRSIVKCSARSLDWF